MISFNQNIIGFFLWIWKYDLDKFWWVLCFMIAPLVQNLIQKQRLVNINANKIWTPNNSVAKNTLAYSCLAKICFISAFSEF